MMSKHIEHSFYSIKVCFINLLALFLEKVVGSVGEIANGELYFDKEKQEELKEQLLGLLRLGV